MEHMAWKGRIKPGCKAEYQRRHAEIWPEMVKVLKDAGTCNYRDSSIDNSAGELNQTQMFFIA